MDKSAGYQCPLQLDHFQLKRRSILLKILHIFFSKWYNDMNGGFLPIPIEFIDNFIMGVTSFEQTDAACGF